MPITTLPMQRLRATGLCLTLLLLGALPQQGAAQDAKVQRDRESLRRQQALLQQARTELDALRSEKAALTKERDDALASARAALAQRAGTQNELQALRAELARQRTAQAETLREQNALRTEEAAASQRRQQELQRERADLQAARDELQRTNQRLVQLLEQRTAEVADLRKRNAALHALALEAVERFVNKGTLETALQDDPLFGLSRVRTESTAEALRIRIEAERSPSR